MITAVVLAGGTGGAKLAAGMQEELGEELAVIANTGDDVEALGVHVSPDPDLCTYWLAGEIDTERGWGIAGDSFTAFERLVELGAPDWFQLSDRDLACCLERRRLLDGGATPTEAQERIARALGVRARVLPMCDQPVRTRVRTADRWLGLQEYLIREQAEPAVEAVDIGGVAEAEPSPEVRAALVAAELIVIGPSNPVISIGPILSIPGMRELITGSSASVVAVSPFVAGEVVKGPTEPLMRAVGLQPTISGIAEAYDGLLDGLVIDAADPSAAPEDLPTASLDTLMDGPKARRRVAREVLSFARSLA